MLTLLLAGALAAMSLAFSLHTLARCRAANRAFSQFSDDDPFERRLADKELRFEMGLGRRNVLALGRASLFGGTGLGVWGLTGGSAHYLEAGVAFGLGLVAWAGCGEAHRRVGSLAGDLRRRARG